MCSSRVSNDAFMVWYEEQAFPFSCVRLCLGRSITSRINHTLIEGFGGGGYGMIRCTPINQIDQGGEWRVNKSKLTIIPSIIFSNY